MALQQPPDVEPAPLAAAASPAAAHRDVWIGYGFAAIGAVLFSTKSIVIKLAYAQGVGVETLLTLRMLISMPLYLAIGGLSVADRLRTGRGMPKVRAIGLAILIGLLGYWFSAYVDFLGLVYIPAQFERLILFTYPVFVVIFGALLFALPVDRRALAAFAISYVGLMMIFARNVNEIGLNALIGAGLVASAAMSFAFYQLLAKQLVSVIGPRLFTCIVMCSAGVAVFIQFLLTQPLAALHVTPHVWGLSLVLAIGGTVLPSFFMNAALHRVSAQANATIGTISPVVTIMLAVVILGENVTWVDIAGTALVLGGIGWFTLGARRG